MSYSRLKEEKVIAGLIENTPNIVPLAVDIGASTGAIWSNVWGLLEKGWEGVLVECDPVKYPQLQNSAKVFPKVRVITEKCTPINVNKMLNGVPCNFGVLSLDIDGYDYHVLRALLRVFKPNIICCELNTCVPPPYRFAVNFDPKYWWGSNTFFGMSISAVYELLVQEHDYKLIEIVDDNAIFSLRGENKDINEAWKEGTLNFGEDSFGKQMARRISSMQIEEGVEFIYNTMWPEYIGKFEVWL